MAGMIMIRLCLIALFSLAVAVPAQAQAPQQGPSFVCTAGQGVVESTICASAALSAADRLMAALYSVNKVSAFGSGPANQLETQRRAVKAMQDCAKPSGRSGQQSIAQCLEGAYDQRNEELAVGAVTRAPDLALPVIRRLDPGFAPLAEAIALWSSEPESTDWAAPRLAAKRQRILTVLRPIVTDLLTSEDKSFYRSVMSLNVRRVEDVLAAPKNLAAVLNVLGPALADDGRVNARAIPCAAIVGHPALLGATQSAFGATPDSFVFNSDCPITLPPLPALDALDGKLNKGWPRCDGTIRFAAYRMYNTSLDEARLGFAKHQPKATLPPRRGVSAADVQAARTELAAYYIRYRGVAQAKAAQMALDALSGVLNTAQECE
jgi:uncharacterized protein